MRVLAVTTNASLVVALGSMMREWEVVTFRDAERATAESSGAAVALIDVGDTDAGIEMAEQLFHRGVAIPCVVVGDKPVDDHRATVLVRPFSLEELGTAVREAASHPVRMAAPAAPAHPVRPEEPILTPESPPPVEQAVPPVGNGSGAVAEWPEPEPLHPESRPRLGLEFAHAPEPEVTEEDHEVLFEEQALEEATEELAVEAPASEPEPEAALEPPEPTRTVWDEPLTQEPVSPAALAPSRWKRRRRAESPAPAEPATEAPLVRRLNVAAAHARELEDLIEQLPFLADVGAMAEGLVGEIDRQFVCAIASVSVFREVGYEVVAHRGLSRVEAGMVIPETQSLFSDVLKTREGVLIQPVDLAQGLVAGIGGARTEAMMVVPALVNDECVAMVVVGGDRFTEQDLDRLSDLAAEAAPGLSVARLLERLRRPAAY